MADVADPPLRNDHRQRNNNYNHNRSDDVNHRGKYDIDINDIDLHNARADDDLVDDEHRDPHDMTPT